MSIFSEFIHAIPHTFFEVLASLTPLVIVFILFQLTVLRLRLKEFFRICFGLIYTFIGLLLFLVGIYTGFMPTGTFLGEHIVSQNLMLLIPVGLVLGFVVVIAEPAVQVLNDQVYTISGGSISKKAMIYSLSIGVGIAVAMSMVRIIYGFSIWWYILPGYLISFILMRFTPDVFTAIAFDSGGVASGPMTATFILPFAMGAASGLGGNIMTSAFGTVALVAMTPLITIQIMGIIYGQSTKEIEDDYNELQDKIEAISDEIELYDDFVYNTEILDDFSPHCDIETGEIILYSDKEDTSPKDMDYSKESNSLNDDYKEDISKLDTKDFFDKPEK